MAWTYNPFTNKLDNKGTMGITQVAADLRYLKLDQTTPQTVINGAPQFDGGITIKTGQKLIMTGS